jgi:hypothetical protein
VTANGHGAYNSRTGYSEATLTMDAPTGEKIEIDAVGDSSTVFMRSNAFSGELPEGKEWMKMEPLLGSSQEEAMLSGSDAAGSLQILSRTSGVQRLGKAKVRGVMTQRYRAEIALDEYGELLREEGKDELADLYEKYSTLVPAPPLVEVWIDSREIVRRNRMVMTIPVGPGQPTVQMDMRMDLFDVGTQPAIVLPDESRVFDATPALEAQLDAIETD